MDKPEISIASERYSVQKIEKIFVLEVNNIQLTVRKHYYFNEEGAQLEDGWNIIGSFDAYDALSDEERIAISEFIDTLNLN